MPPAGESPRLTAMFAGAAALAAGAGFALASSAADAMFLARIGAEHLGSVFAVSSGLLVAVLAVLGGAADRAPAGRLLVGIAAAGAALLILLASLGGPLPRASAVALLVVTKQLGSAFELTLWVVLAEKLDAREARRKLPVLVAVQGAGHAAGAFALDPVSAWWGTGAAVAIAAALFAVAAIAASRLVATSVHRVSGATARPAASAVWTAGARAVAASRLARQLAVVVAIAGAFAPILYYLLGASAQAAYGSETEIAAFLGKLRGGVQLVILVVQLAMAPAVASRIGVATMLLVAPVGSMLAAIAVAVNRDLAVVASAQALARVVDAAIQSPGEKLTQNLLSRDVRGRIGGFLDGVAKRAGAIGGGIAASAMVAWPRAMAVVTIAVAAAWLIASWRLRRQFPDLAVGELSAAPRPRGELERDDAAETIADDRSIRRLRESLGGGPGHAVAVELIADLGASGRIDAIAELATAAVAAGDRAPRAALIGGIQRLITRGVAPGVAAVEPLIALAIDAERPAEQRAVAVRALGVIPGVARAEPELPSAPRSERSGQELRGGTPRNNLDDAIAAAAGAADPGLALAGQAAQARRAGRPADIDPVVDAALASRIAPAFRAAVAELSVDVGRLAPQPERAAGRIRSLLRAARSTDRAGTLEALARALTAVPPASAELILVRSSVRELAVELAADPSAASAEREWAIEILRALASPSDAPILVQALGDRDESVRRAAAEALQALGPDALEPLLIAAAYGRRQARNAALEIVRDMRVASAVLDDVIERELAAIAATAVRLPALARLERGDLVVRRLVERIDEVAHTLFLVAEARLGDRTIGEAARRFLRAVDPAARARALEALDAVLPRGLSIRLLGALESAPHEVRAERAAEIAEIALPEVDEAVRGELEGDDSLARALVVAALGAPGRASHREAITAAAERAGRDRDPLALLRRIAAGDDAETKEADMPRTVETMMALSQIPLFAELTMRQFEELSAVVRWLTASPGDELVREGDPGDAMYFVQSGRVRVDRGDAGRVTELGPGEPFGEMALFEGEPRSATVTAIERSRIGRIERADFEELVDDVPGIALAIGRVLARRLRR